MVKNAKEESETKMMNGLMKPLLSAMEWYRAISKYIVIKNYKLNGVWRGGGGKGVFTIVSRYAPPPYYFLSAPPPGIPQRAFLYPSRQNLQGTRDLCIGPPAVVSAAVLGFYFRGGGGLPDRLFFAREAKLLLLLFATFFSYSSFGATPPPP